ncbi:Ig-like domain-containing protein [Undibacterium cyanobacteriorum]|uniref:Ig-like domain-containing protein n=1 Tax=Undibacterium cyanobacteriorum TaxID=3073561 RepID=A0ABY9RIN3_9BURK|nr:Ig-like domain-containing protein [Undibacterium sp. 20NA77.5]WMW81081.1 Ig-like domain-containing protein [Undibacterium sp. 20NA77.5]
MAVTSQMRTQVAQLYVSLFGRAPEASGLGYWVGQLSNGVSLQQIAQDMFNVAPSRAYYPSFLTNEEIITKFYVNVLGRNPDAGGLAYWTGRLNTLSSTGTTLQKALATGSVILEMITAVVNYNGTDAAGLQSQSLFNNKVAVALKFAVEMQGESIPDASTLIPLVTAGANGQDAANAQIAKLFNKAPTITSAATATIAENAAISTQLYKVVGADADSGAVLTYSLKAVGDASMLDINPTTGVVTLKASANFEAKSSYSFTVVVTDQAGATSEKEVVATVTNVNEAPVATAATGSGFENTTLTGSVAATDVDAGDVVTYTLVAGSATNGTVTLNSTTGAYTFTPNANYFGPATFQFIATDRAGLQSAATTVSLTVIDVANSLTAGQDVVTMTNPAAEAVIGTNRNLNAGDVITGGANDKLTLGLDSAMGGAAFAGFNLNIGTFQVTNDSGNNAVTFDMSSSTGVNTLVSTNSSNDVRFNFANTVADTDADGFDEVNLQVLNLTAGVNTTLDIRNLDAAGNDELNLTVTNSEDNTTAAGSINVTAQGTGGVDQNTAAGIELVNLSTAGSASDVRINDLNTPGATVLNVSTAKTLVIGDTNLSLTAIENDLSASVVTVNAAGSTGDIALGTKASSAAATITGGSGNDTFETSDTFGDSVVAGAGNDTVRAGGGNNFVDGGEGDDNISAGAGNDSIAGGAGNNTIAAGDGINVITAGDGNNNVTSGTGVDTITLGNGANTVVSGAGNDAIVAGNGGNTVDAGDGDDTVATGSGNDTINTGNGNNVVTSGAGNDTITVGTGLDTVNAGAGDDIIIAGANFDASGTTTPAPSTVQDSIIGGDGADELRINAGSVDANFRNVSSIETLTLQTAGNTTLQGNNVVAPGTSFAQAAGIRTINAKNAGNDNVDASTFSVDLTVNLTAGTDSVLTGSGSDTFNVTGLDDSDMLNAGAGVDVLNLDADTTLTAANKVSGFETINLDTGRNNTVVDANQYNIVVDNDNAPNPNVLNAGVLTVNGSALQAAADLNTDGDMLDAGEAAETLVFDGSGVSTFGLNVTGGAANDTITGGTLTSVIASGAGNDTVNTVGGANTVTTGAGNDVVNFGAATDNVNAGEGNDTLNVGANLTIADTIDGGDGTDTITTGTGYGDTVFTNVSNVEVLTLTAGVTSTLGLKAQAAGIRTINGVAGTADVVDASAYTTGNLTINGNGGNDTLKSGAGADTINGGSGDDSIESGAGADLVVSGAGTDNIKLGAGNDVARFSGSQLDATDVIDGGADTDTVELANAAFAPITANVNLTNVTNVENFKLTGSGDDGDALTNDVDANSVTFSGGTAGTITSVNVNASALTDAKDSFKVTLAAGTNANYQFNITGSSTSDTFEKLNVGVNNNVSFNAGAGNDSVVITGGDLGANITVLGGTGEDSLVQNGGVFIDDDMQNVFGVEVLTTVAGPGKAINAVLGAQVDANMGLQKIVGGANNDRVILDAAFGAVTTALNVNLAAGGNDTINAGATNVAVTFVAGASNITAGDALTGGMTANDVFTLTADNGTADLTTTTGVETFNVVQSDDNNIGLVINDNTFAGVASNTLTINATALDGTNNATAAIGGLTLNAGSVTKALVVNAGEGNDNITTGSGADIINLGSGDDTVNAGSGDNTITNHSGNKTITTLGGADSITLGDGNHNVNSGAGNDTITTGNGNSMVDAGTGNDTITVGNGNNVIVAGDGNDVVVTGTGNNNVDGGAGADRITLGGSATSSNTVTGGAGADTIVGSAGADTFRYIQLSDSDGTLVPSANKDVIVGFDTVKDKVAIEAAMFGNNSTLLNFAGNAANFADAQGAIQLGANNGKADYVYQADTGRLWVDLNDDGVLNGADLQINFRNADGSIPSSMTFAAGNVITQDTIAPTAPTLSLLAASDSNINNDRVTNLSPVTVRVTLNSTTPGTAAIAGDRVTLSNGQVATLTAGDITAGYKDFSVNLTANAVNTLTAVVSNDPAAPIQGPASAASAALVITHDNTAPTAVVVDTTSPALISTDARPVQTYSVTFSEPVSGFSLADLNVAGGTASNLVQTGATTYTFDITVNDNSNTSVSVNVLAGAVIDLAGNTSTVSNSVAHAVDTTNPTVVITDGVAGTANIATGAITYTFTFSEAVSGFDASDVVVTNGTKGLFTGAPGSTVYTLVVTPTADFEGNMTVAIGANAAIDANGNNSVAATDNVQVVDTLRPTITIATPIAGDGLINAAEDNTVTIAGSATGAAGQTISVSVSDGVHAAVTGTATVLANGTWSSSTMDVSGLNNGTLTFTANVSDAAGNAASPAGTATATLDNVAPSATISDNKPGTLWDGDNTVTYTINFNEAVTGFAQGDLVVTGGTITGFTQVTASQYTVTVQADDNSVADIALSFAAGAANDLAGNASIAAAAAAQPVDTVNPTYVSFVDDQPAYANVADGVVTYTVVFSEAVTNFALSDLTVTGGTASNLVNTVGNTWTFDVSAAAGSTTPISVSIAAGALTDMVGNLTLTAGTPAGNPQLVDRVAPTVVINDFDGADGYLNATEDNALVISGTASDVGAGVVGQTITVTVTDGVTPVVGTATVGAGGVWSYNFGNQSATWANNAALTVTATVNDVAGNASTAATGTTTSINDKLVTPFTADDVAGNNQINLAEKNTGVTVTGTVEAGSTVYVDVGGVTRQALVTGTSYSYSLTPADYFNLGQGTSTFTITATDVAGNTASTTKSVTVDTVVPTTPSITNFSTDTGVVGDNITTDETLVLTGFAEPNSTVTLYNAMQALGTVTADGAGAWTFTTATDVTFAAAFKPTTTNLADGQYLFSVTATDAVGNVSAPSATQQVLVDTGIAAPTITGFTVNTGATNETGVDAANAIVTKDNTLLITGAAGSAEGGATVYVYSVSAGPTYTLMGQTVADATGAYTFATGLLADGTYQFAASQRDLANNDSVTVLGAAGYSATKFVTVDTAAPVAPTWNVAAVTSADNGDSASDEITNDATITLNGTVTADATSAQTVNIYSDAGLTTLVGTVVVPAGSTAYTLSVPGSLAQGSYTYYATSTDAAANTSVSSAALPVVIDLTPPTIGLTLGADTDNTSTATAFGSADNITSQGNFTIAAADALSGLSATAAVTMNVIGTVPFLGGQYASVAAAQAALDAFMDAREAAHDDGTYTVQIGSTDVAGNNSTAWPLTATITLDTTAPTTPTIALTTDSGTNNSDLISNSVAISVTAGGVDTNATQTQYSINGGGTWLDATQYAAATTADGAYSVTARVVDAAGNVSVTSNVLNVVKDNTAPTLTVGLVSDSGSSALDLYTNDADLTALVAGADASTTYSITVTSGPTSYTTATYASLAAALADFNAAPLADGVYTVTASAEDGAGNIGSTPITFTLDTAADVLSVALATDTSNSNPPGTGTTSDGYTQNGTVNVSGLTAGSTWTYDTDGTIAGGFAGTGSSLTLTANTAFAAGNVVVESTDLAGNVSAVAVSGALWTTDTTVPATFTMPTAVDLAGADGTLSGSEVAAFVLENFTGSAAEAGAAVYYTISDTDPLTADITGSMSAATWTGAGSNISLSSLSNGTITVTANQVDIAGNVGASASRTFTMNKNMVTITGATYDNALNTLTLTGDFGTAGLANGVIPTSGAGSIDFSKLSWEHNDAGTLLNFASLVTGGTAASLSGGTTLTIQLDANAADSIETNGAFLDGTADVINVESDFVFGGVAGTTSSFGTGATGINYSFQGGLAAEVIIGDAGNDTINGGNGADTITGGAGNDSIIGGNGADNLTGGTGNDTFNVTASRTSSLDVIQDFGATDFLNMGYMPYFSDPANGVGYTPAAAIASASGPARDVNVVTAFASTGSDLASLNTDLATAVANGIVQHAAGAWQVSGDTFIVQLTGASLAGNNVYYVIQNQDGNATFDPATDVAVALVGTSIQPPVYGNFTF